jgi:PAS domain S-box-containing protein
MDSTLLPLLFSITQEGTWDYSFETDIIVASDRYYEIIGYAPQSIPLTASFYYSHVHSEDLTSTLDEMKRHLAHKNSRKETKHRFIKKDGKIAWIEALGKVIEWDKDGNPKRMIGVLRDITDETLAKLELINERAKNSQSSKLATLGEMASGIAHEINNPLTIIRGYLKMIEYMALEKNISREEIIDSIKKTQNAIERTSKIVSSLKYFSRDASQDPFEIKSIKDVIEDTLSFCQTRLEKRNVFLDIKIPDEEIMVKCRPVEISQILLNLILNSFDAVRSLPPEKRWIKLIVNSSLGNIELRILDNGEGVDPKVLPKLFEPFNTTKPSGQGTGLGLSISKNIARAHQGDLILESQKLPTTFLLTLPLSK